MEEDILLPTTQPPKFSRYRSVRQAAAGANTKRVPAPDLPKAPSRYHTQALRKPCSPPTKQVPNWSPKPPTDQSGSPLPHRRAAEDKIPEDAFGSFGQRTPLPLSTARGPDLTPQQATQDSGSKGRRTRVVAKDNGYSTRPKTRDGKEQPQFSNPGQQEAFDILTGEAERQKRLRQKQIEEDRARRVEAKERELARKVEEEREQVRKAEEDRERSRKVEEEREQALQAKREHDLAKRAQEEKAAALKAQRSELVSRGRSTRRPTLSRKEPEREPNQGNATKSEKEPLHMSLGTPPRKAQPFAPGGNNAHSGIPAASSAAFDAPKSAVNAGTRTVIVKHMKTSITLPVTPQSTPKDLLALAQKELGVDLAAAQAVLVESFEQLGLERPMRWYEHVRDTMNSWDQDHQNKLLIELSSTGMSGADLGVQDAPDEQPGDTSVSIYHSQKPGVWDKRWVTLRSDGQVLVAKPNGAEARNACHMSDFDVYFPTTRQAKRLKPPKKHCFAIKSQQKSAMFLSTENFVHFFATKDREVADAWYKAVQGWRSWYLAHEMGLGRQKPGSAAVIAKPGHSRMEDLPKTNILPELGAFKPLMPPGGLLGEDQPLALAADATLPTAKPSPPRPFRDRGGPPVSYPKKLMKDPRAGPVSSTPRYRSASKSSIVQGPPPSSVEQPFASTSLLGRTYSQRQRALQMDPNGIKDPLTQPQPGAPAIRPLVDLTLEHPRAPPRQARTGHGVHLEQLPVGGLVDAATSLEQPFTTVPAPGLRRSSDLQRSGTVRSTHQSVEQRRPPLPEDAFTGGGLLARSGDGQGGRLRGRGVQCGDRTAREPLLDLTEASRYAPGSLLADVEKYMGDEGGPVLDREKRIEVTTKTGEAA